MKTILKLILPIFVACHLTACLDERMITSLEKSEIYDSKESVESALTGCYAPLGSSTMYGGSLFEALSCSSGLLTYKSKQPGSNMYEWFSLTILPADNSFHLPIYTSIFDVIGRTNDLLFNLESCPLDTSFKEEIAGEARFLRANMYFLAARIWGPVPLYLEPAHTLEDTYRPREPLASLYKTICDDLEYAWQHMRDIGTQRADRPHRWAAKATLAKVYMQMACILAHDGEPFSNIDFGLTEAECWENCYTLAKEVHDGDGQNPPPYRLVRPYADLMSMDNQNSQEAIFEIQISKAVPNLVTQRTIPNQSTYTPLMIPGGSNWGRIRPNREIFSAHQSRYPGDPRIDASYIYGEVYYLEGAAQDNGKPLSGKIDVYPLTPGASTKERMYPYLKKYLDPGFISGWSDKNMIAFRYGEVLLMLAEAANETNRSDEAIGYINELLARARYIDGAEEAAQPADWTTESFVDEEGGPVDRESLRRAILLERRYELMGELTEWFDVRRMGIQFFLDNVAGPHNEHFTNADPKVQANMSEYPTEEDAVRRILLWPLPQEEINTNPKIDRKDQNFGY